MHQVALDQAQALGHQEIWDSEAVECANQLSTLLIVHLLCHCFHVHLEVLVDHLEIVDSVAEKTG